MSVLKIHVMANVRPVEPISFCLFHYYGEFTRRLFFKSGTFYLVFYSWFYPMLFLCEL